MAGLLSVVIGAGWSGHACIELIMFSHQGIVKQMAIYLLLISVRSLAVGKLV